MFSNIYKDCSKYGEMVTPTSGITYSSFEKNDTVYSTGGTKYYYNKDVPLMLYNYNIVVTYINNAGSTGWIVFEDVYEEDKNMSSARKIVPAYNGFNIESDGSCKLRLTINNTNSTPFTLKCIAYTRNLGLFASSSSTSPTSATVITLYENISDGIEVPANDSIILELTFSNGDIASVSQV